MCTKRDAAELKTYRTRTKEKQGALKMYNVNPKFHSERMPPFLGITTAAQMAGISRRHFFRIVRQDKIRTVQIGRKFFVSTTDFLAWARDKKLKIVLDEELF
jgi:excisionase family DNA binding protein